PFGKTQTSREWQETLQHNSDAFGRPYVTHVATLFKKARLERVAAACTSHCLLLTLRDRETGIVATFGNVHLQAGPGASHETRQKQLNSAVDKAGKEARAAGAGPVLLAGDCNDGAVAATG